MKKFSIVLCTYNGAKKIEQALNSLMALDYPKDYYEVIVVDDGSKDNTEKIVRNFDVIYIKHDKNKGLSAARNSGLAKATGEIFICFDDDIIAQPNWLNEISKIFENEDAIGGSCLIDSPEKGNLVDLFFTSVGYGNPIPLAFTKNKTVLSRLISYIKSMYEVEKHYSDSIFEVGELPGGNSSFRVSQLKEINGWNENLSGIEDLDLCKRLKTRFKNGKFLATSKTTLIHDHKISVLTLLRNQITRGGARISYYIENNTIPPIFPFPFLYVGCVLATIVFKMRIEMIISAALIFPVFIYSWWSYRAIKKLNPSLIALSYVQLTHEITTMIGFIIGYFKLRRRS